MQQDLLEHLVFEIAQGLSGETGEAFFHSLVSHLARALPADCVWVGALQPGGDRLSTLAVHSNGPDVPPAEYDLLGTPCANLSGKTVWSYPSDVQKVFPGNPLLTGMNAESYIGAPLLDSTGRSLGLICALSQTPLTNLKLGEALLQVFAARAAAELERKKYEDALAANEQRLRGFVEHGNEGLFRVAVEPPIPMGLPEDQQVELAYQRGYIADCNDQGARLFGRADAKELIGLPLEAISPRSDPEQDERIRMAIRAGSNFSQVERTVGNRRLLMTRQGIVEDGKVKGAWVGARDITVLKEAEAEVRRLNVELEERLAEVTQLKKRLEQDNSYLLDEINSSHNFGEMVGSSPKFRELADRIRLVAPTSATVLICGETGVGKELVAREIHNLSPRRNRPLVKVNCAAIASGLVESELFGHVKGAFTGATERRMGRFEYANGGTLFLDEITELPPESQAKLLRVLQEQELELVGSNQTVKIDVRLLAATNRSLSAAVREGRFRMDLYYRLLVVPVDVPALRDRREDISALASHFVDKLSRQLGRKVTRISEKMMHELLAYDWPGNVRELENLLARAIVLSQGDILDVPVMPIEPGQSSSSATIESMEEAERRHIETVLNAAQWILEGPRGAAEALKMNPSTLRSRMKRLGIQRPRHTARA